MGLNTVLKNRAKVVNTDSLRENRQVSWKEVLCKEILLWDRSDPALDRFKLPTVVKFSENRKLKTGQVRSKLLCTCSKWLIGPAQCHSSHISHHKARYLWYWNGVPFPITLIHPFFTHLTEPAPFLILTSITSCFSEDNTPHFTELH